MVLSRFGIGMMVAWLHMVGYEFLDQMTLNISRRRSRVGGEVA